MLGSNVYIAFAVTMKILTLRLTRGTDFFFFKNRPYPDRTINEAKQRVPLIELRFSAHPPIQVTMRIAPVVISYHPRTLNCFANMNHYTKHIFTAPPITAYRRERNIGDGIVCTCDSQSPPGTTECKRPRCRMCAHIFHASEIKGSNGVCHHTTSSFTWEFDICHYLPTLSIGETATPLSVRFSDHSRFIRSNLSCRSVAAHFNSNGHTINGTPKSPAFYLPPVIPVRIVILQNKE